MNNRITIGCKVKHFKGGIYTVLNIAEHVDGGTLVIYKNNDKIWARDFDEFNSEVDKKKYPDVKQKYRFEVL